jgi:hypothetical protein
VSVLQPLNVSNNLSATIMYQIISLKTNEVLFNTSAQLKIKTDFLSFIAAGTADSLGMHWNTDGDVYGFRAAVEIFDNASNPIPNALDVSAVTWFRLKHTSTL